MFVPSSTGNETERNTHSRETSVQMGREFVVYPDHCRAVTYTAIVPATTFFSTFDYSLGIKSTEQQEGIHGAQVGTCFFHVGIHKL